MTSVVERGQHIRLYLESMGRLGDALAHYGDLPVFVFGGIPGEEVIVEVVRHPRKYIAAQVVEVVSPSQYRVSSPCGYFGQCTGCQWQHISYEYQLQLKREAVQDALNRVGQLDGVSVLPTIPSKQELGYRNHARFTVGPNGSLGFVHRERRRFVEIDDCLLMDPWINGALGQLQRKCAETTQVAVRYGPGTGDWLIQPTLKSPNIPLETGKKHYRDSLLGINFRVAASSFFQVNIPQAELLTTLVRAGLNLSGNELLVDAYAGVGTFAGLLAPYSRKVIAIEESLSAIQDAEENLAPFSNIELRRAKVEEALDGLEVPVDAVVVDPPRVGCHQGALESLIRLASPRLVYVSCEPTALARDLKVLKRGAYHIESVQPVDMFPQTHHVECVATLVLDPTDLQ